MTEDAVLDLTMELRQVDESQRLVVGVVVPYDELTYLTPDPRGERVRRGAFHRSIAHRADRIPLFRNHDRQMRMGVSRSFQEDDAGLLGEFRVNEGAPGDELLEEARAGYLSGLSAGFVPLDRGRSQDGAAEILEAKLVEVSLVGHPAYEGAGMFAVRSAQDLDELLAPFRARPDVNLAPLPPLFYGQR
jgi:Escherichia/Staphylococcus phage prohead protease